VCLVGTFPFGQPVLPVVQLDHGRKSIFVLGVYASAVHARWVGTDDSTLIMAVGVASEPEIFWCGDGAEEIVRSISLPPAAGRLLPANGHNGPSGQALDSSFLDPLGVSRKDAWLCDLVPHSCMNPGQQGAIERSYLPQMERLGLPRPNWPFLPNYLSDATRRSEIEAEIQESNAKVIITLGDQPLRWFTAFHGSHGRLSDYGEEPKTYGRFHHIVIGGREMQLLPLVHPRQAAPLGSHSKKWTALHGDWVEDVAPNLLAKEMHP
jgi:uracil-DNA glycosylase